MNGFVRTDRVPIQQLTFLDVARIRSRDPDPKLIASIAASGVLQPLIAVDAGRWLLLDGYQRRAALPETAQVPVQIFRDASEAMAASVLLNMSVRPYTEMEKAAVVGCWDVLVGADDDRIRTDILPMMGFKPTVEILNRCRSVIQLAADLRDLLWKKSAPLQFAERISRESKTDQQYLAAFFRSQRLSMSRIMTVYDWIFYVRNQSDQPVQGLLGNLEPDRALEQLENIRYPRTSHLRERCCQISAGYTNPLTFPPDFAGGSPAYSFRPGTHEDVRRALLDLEKMLTDKELFDLMAELRGED